MLDILVMLVLVVVYLLLSSEKKDEETSPSREDGFCDGTMVIDSWLGHVVDGLFVSLFFGDDEE